MDRDILYEEDARIERMVARLLPRKPDDFNNILRELKRLISVLDRYGDANNTNLNLHRLAPAAIQFSSGTERHDLVMQIVKISVFRTRRLHFIVILQYFNVDAIILLNNVIRDFNDCRTQIRPCTGSSSERLSLPRR